MLNLLRQRANSYTSLAAAVVQSESDCEYECEHYMVQQGDSLESIASLHKTSVSEIRAANRDIFPIGERGDIFTSQILNIPPPKHSVSVASGNNRVHRIYVVCHGDTVSAISEKFGVTASEIRCSNRETFLVSLVAYY